MHRMEEIMASLKYSRQREAIKSFLAQNHIHPTADTVYMNIRETFPNISLGTVYRNLSLLSEIGEIQKISMNDGADRFDARTEPHDHFVCRKCHCVLDICLDDNTELTTAAQQHFDGKIYSHSTLFYGCCKDCLKKELSAGV